MSLVQETITGVRATLIFWVLTALLYPFLMLLIGQIFPYQANGSIIINAQGQAIGSALIGQPFTSDRYFNSRPSTSSYSTVDPQKDEAGILKTGVSGASNLAPSNTAKLLKDNRAADAPDLLARIMTDADKFKQAGITPTADLLYTSGSSLDPHITVDGAKVQVARIAQTRNLQPNQVEALISQNTDGRFLGIFGEPGVNVLKLNLTLDKLGQS